MAIVALSRKTRTRLYLLISVLLSVLIAYGIRVTPRADAAQITAREDTGDLIIETTDDDMIGITIKSLGIRFEDNLDAAPKDTTEEKLVSQMNEVKTALKREYGWDLNDPPDRREILDETHRLSQALHSIPDSDLRTEEHKPVRALRDLVDMLDGITECRARCLPEAEASEQFRFIIAAAAVGSALAAIHGEFADPSLPTEYVNSVIEAMTVVYTVFTLIVSFYMEFLTGISTRTLLNASMAVMFGALLMVHNGMSDARQIASTKSTTPKDGTRQAAKEISALTPEEGDDGHDYDVVNDEL